MKHPKLRELIPPFLLLFALAQIVPAIGQEEGKKPGGGTQHYQKEIDAAPSALAEIRKQIDLPVAPFDPKGTATLSVAEIEAKKGKVEAKLSAARDQAETLSFRNAERIDRMAKLPAEISRARETLNSLGADPESDISEKSKIAARLETLEWERKSYTATSALFAAREELNRRDVTILEQQQREWQNLYDAKRAEETQRSRKQAEDEAARYSDTPVLAGLAKQNAGIAKLREQITGKTAENATHLAELLHQLKEVREQRAIAEERIKLLESAKLEMDTETGRLLRLQRRELASPESIATDLQETIRTSASAQISLLETRKRLSSFPIDLDGEAARLLAKSGTPDLKQSEIRLMLSRNQQLLRDLIEDLSDYIDSLNATSTALRNLSTEQTLYGLFLDERLLWIPSAGRIGAEDFAVEKNAVVRIFSHDQMGLWLRNLVVSLKKKTFGEIVFGAVLILLLLKRKRLLKILESTSHQARDKRMTSIIPTFLALAATLVLALPLPVLFGFLAWSVRNPPGLHRAFLVCGAFFFIFGAFRWMTAKTGLLRNHIGMEPDRIGHLRWHLGWFLCVTPIVIFLFVALPGTDAGPQAGRLFFTVLMLLQMAFLHLVLRPSRNMLTGSLWVRRLAWIVGVAIPFGFLVGSGLGYISSVNTLREQTMLSVFLILIGLLVVKILERWILLSRRRLALEIAHRKYQAQLEKRKAKSDDGTQPQASLEKIEADATDVVTVEAQTRKILKLGTTVVVIFGMLSIWASSLPALSFLDRIELWGGSEVRTVEPSAGAPSNPISGALIPDGGGQGSEKAPVTETGATSLQDLILAVVVILLFLTAARNLPGLLELSLLRRLKLRPGGNYAITTVLKYFLVVLGFLIAFGMIGISWKSVQWLAAAVTLGIGFGLQEIFANFVAGIILLFERPIRLGDIVTVKGDISGKVTKIRIRATTILQFNQRELIVPNKEFITGSLINWTFSAPMQRFEIPVGIAYGSDTEKATRILHGILNDHPKVMKTPASQIIFSAFGASTLDFLLRGYVANLDDFVTTQSELHYQIDNAFRDADIDIAIPQQDIYIRALPEGFTKESLVGTPPPEETRP